ncbi:T9SS C-terminal target domain-containing protein [Maribellus luteus]|uniref:T9SS C-terminal target domain-containing protein n=1 Tax=Maribellus luteus TaxID=2305463 RepID=A0A399SYW7_9BACT|nr:T9SS type A sorting domain-containing protein [Maribellus luteus]RIJ47207.1 T9SS C-terminal target domain-containing protein [Maribellus luteus]
MNKIYMTLRTPRTALMLLLTGFLLLSANTVFGQTISTDKDDYYPGEIVVVTGTGWEPNEMVMLKVEHLTFDHQPEMYTTFADQDGNILDDLFEVQFYDLGESYRLTATGTVSEEVAVWYFTDSPKIGTITIGTQQGILQSGVSGSVQFDVTVTRGNSNANFYANLCIDASNFPSGLTYSFSPASSGINGDQEGVLYFNDNSITELAGTLTVFSDGTLTNGSFSFGVLTYAFPDNKPDSHNCSNPAEDNAVAEIDGVVSIGVPPSFTTCPGNIQTGTDTDACNTQVSYAVAVDGNPTPDISYEFTGATTGSGSGDGSGSVFEKGLTYVTLTASNGVGDDATCSFTITVTDDDAPVSNGSLPTGESDMNLCYSDMPAGPTADEIKAYFSDNCGVVNVDKITQEAPDNDNCTWSVTYTYDVYDDAGNHVDPSPIVSYSGSDQTAPSLTGTPFSDPTEYNACMTDAQSTVPAWSETNAITGYTDNCGQNVSASLDSTKTTGNDCDWTVTYYYTVFDECNNPLEGLTYQHQGGDLTAPTGTPPSDISGVNDCKPTQEEADAGFDSDLAVSGYTDNCGGDLSVSLSTAVVSGNDCDWTITYTFEVQDKCGNPLAGQVYKVSGGDETPPTVATQNIEVRLGPDGTVTISPEDIDNGSSDNCDSDPLMELDITEFSCDNIGENTVTLTVTDECDNSANATATVTVYVPTTTVAKISAESARYMDDITFYAEIESNCQSNDFAGQVEFFLNNVSVGSAPAYPIPYDEEGYPTKLRATLIHKITEMPGEYELVAKFSPSTNYYDGSTSEPTSFLILARSADAYNSETGFYTGTLLAWTTGENSSTGTITLATVLKDSHTPTGDLRGAKVTFYTIEGDKKTPIPSAKNLPVGLVDMTDGTVGIASADVQFDIGNSQAESFEIYVEVSGAYYNGNGDDFVMVTVAKPIPGGSIFGSGNLLNEDSNGQLKGADNELTWFQFDVTYNKKKTNPQGKMTIRWSSWYKPDGTLDGVIHEYQLKTNAINLMVLSGDQDPTYGKLDAGKAIFDAKANLSELIDGVYVGVDGNSPLHVTMTDPDFGEIDAGDEMIGITYFNSAGGIWFSSNYSLDGNEITKEQFLNVGTIEVKTDGTTSGESTPKPGKNKSAEIATSSQTIVTETQLSVYPNPFSEQARFEFVSPVAAQARIDVYDMAGRMVQTIYDGFVEENTVYNAEFKPENQVSGMYFYKMKVGDSVFNGKLIYKRE